MTIRALIAVFILFISGAILGQSNVTVTEELVLRETILNPKYYEVEDWLNRIIQFEVEDPGNVTVIEEAPILDVPESGPGQIEQSNRACGDLACNGTGDLLHFCMDCPRYGPYFLGDGFDVMLVCSEEEQSCRQITESGQTHDLLDDLFCMHESILFGKDCEYNQEELIGTFPDVDGQAITDAVKSLNGDQPYVSVSGEVLNINGEGDRAQMRQEVSDYIDAHGKYTGKRRVLFWKYHMYGPFPHEFGGETEDFEIGCHNKSKNCDVINGAVTQTAREWRCLLEFDRYDKTKNCDNVEGRIFPAISDGVSSFFKSVGNAFKSAGRGVVKIFKRDRKPKRGPEYRQRPGWYVYSYSSVHSYYVICDGNGYCESVGAGRSSTQSRVESRYVETLINEESDDFSGWRFYTESGEDGVRHSLLESLTGFYRPLTSDMNTYYSNRVDGEPVQIDCFKGKVNPENGYRMCFFNSEYRGDESDLLTRIECLVYPSHRDSCNPYLKKSQNVLVNQRHGYPGTKDAWEEH